MSLTNPIPPRTSVTTAVLVAGAVCFVALLAAIVAVIALEPAAARNGLLTAAIPTLASLGSAAVVYVRAAHNAQLTEQRSNQVAGQVADASELVTQQVSVATNGAMKARVKEALIELAAEHGTIPAPPGPPPPPPTGA